MATAFPLDGIRHVVSTLGEFDDDAALTVADAFSAASHTESGVLTPPTPPVPSATWSPGRRPGPATVRRGTAEAPGTRRRIPGASLLQGGSSGRYGVGVRQMPRPCVATYSWLPSGLGER